jgi:hypothetical protein
LLNHALNNRDGRLVAVIRWLSAGLTGREPAEA